MPQIINPKLISWASEIDANTIEQAERTSRLPVVTGHIALMPDAHLGIGATIGSVIPTAGAIIPAAVGVDIGCFHGDTRVPLLDGTQSSLRDLAEREESFWVYSIDVGLDVVPGRAVAMKTRSDAELMRVVVSGGDAIVCTPDHLFMLSDGTYHRADELKFNDSLMPLYRKWQKRDGYESCSPGTGRSRRTHIAVYETLNGPVPPGYVVHHLNHVHFDNSPENLVLWEVGEHSRYHRKLGKKFDNSSPTFQERRLEGIRRFHADPENRERWKLHATANIIAYMAERPEHFAAAVEGNGRRGAKYLAQFNVTPRACDDCGEVQDNPAQLQWHKKREHQYNHKVVCAEHLSERADVYCLQVEEHHNFALSAGVFVHNCGMVAAELNVTADQLPDSLDALMPRIEYTVPAGVGKGHDCATDAALEWMQAHRPPATDLTLRQESTALNQFGTLGSGNHFFEICLDERDAVWVMLHSGSRGIGNQLAQSHISRAKELAKLSDATPLEDPDLAWFTQGTGEFNAYVTDLLWAQDYALANRNQMLNAALPEVLDYIGFGHEVSRISCHHNFVAQEHHGGKDLWITRKGAIQADIGRLGIIPGSMGTKSYVVEGKGNPISWNSCSHGAGRRMSRNAARKMFTAADLAEQMGDRTWLSDRAEDLIDEIPSSYKDIDVVMADQADLVEIKHTLRSVLNYKGA